MAAQAVSLRTQLAVAITLLQSGAVDQYALFFELELSGEDSPEMHLVREVCSEMGVTDNDLILWQQSYLTRLGRAAHSIEQQLNAGTLSTDTLINLHPLTSTTT